jgi:hypothetical protein
LALASELDESMLFSMGFDFRNVDVWRGARKLYSKEKKEYSISEIMPPVP